MLFLGFSFIQRLIILNLTIIENIIRNIEIRKLIFDFVIGELLK